MMTAMKTIAFVPAPNQIMISGPSAIFGRLFKTTIYGSRTFLVLSDHHIIIAITIPKIDAMKKPSKVSYSVVKI